MIRPNRTNPEFELGGVSHVAPQHFFFNAGNGDCVGFFCFTDTRQRSRSRAGAQP